MMSIIQKRKLLRLHNFDYNLPGAYFITFCTHNRNCFLSKISAEHTDSFGTDIITPELNLTKFGDIVDNIIQTIPERFNVKLDRYVIMPNHVHLVIDINFPDFDKTIETNELPENYRSVISKIIGYIKMNSSKEIRKICSLNKIWQRGYHDHVIRNRDDYHVISQYIIENPKRWFYDKYYIDD